MAESRIQNAFSRSTVLTVGRLLAFIVVGFAVGLALGVVTEEPELLAGHLRGDTTTVELDAARTAKSQAEQAEQAAEAARAAAKQAAEEEGWVAGPVDTEPLLLADGESREVGGEGDGLPPVSAGPLEDANEAGSATGAEGRVSGEPLRAMPVVAPAAGGSFAIQVGAFGDEPSADRLARQLESKGYPIEVLPAGAESNRWRVRVQPLGDEPTARSTAERIEREERLPTWVIRLEGQSRP